jgi:RNA-directed DNA polymerase
VLANCALDGLERLLKEKYPTGTRLKSLGGKYPSVNLIRYADDFVITGKSRELLEGGVKPLVEQFLKERGLELSPTKTLITQVTNGFDFLGQNVRRYPNGKLLIKPSKKNIKTFLDGIRRTIKAALGMSAADLIKELNPKIRGWANYHRHAASKRTFHRVDRAIFYCLPQFSLLKNVISLSLRLVFAIAPTNWPRSGRTRIIPRSVFDAFASLNSY